MGGKNSGQYQKEKTDLHITLTVAERASLDYQKKLQGIETDKEYVSNALEHVKDCRGAQNAPEAVVYHVRGPVPCIKCKKPIVDSDVYWVSGQGGECPDCHYGDLSDESVLETTLKTHWNKKASRVLLKLLAQLCDATEAGRGAAHFTANSDKYLNDVSPRLERLLKELGNRDELKFIEDFKRESDEFFRYGQKYVDLWELLEPLAQKLVRESKRKKEAQRIEA